MPNSIYQIDEALAESIAGRDKQIDALTEQLKKLNAAVTAAYNLIPVHSDEGSES